MLIKCKKRTRVNKISTSIQIEMQLKPINRQTDTFVTLNRNNFTNLKAKINMKEAKLEI